MSKKEVLNLIKWYFGCNLKGANKIYTERKKAGTLDSLIDLLQDYLHQQAKISFYDD